MIKRIINIFLKPNNQPINSGGKIIPYKNISVGRDSDISKANFFLRSEDNTRINIGTNCIVESNFVIEKSGGTITIGDRTFIGGKGLFVSAERISIGSDVMFSWGCTVIDNNAHSLNWKDRVDDVIDWKKGMNEGFMGKYKNWDRVEKGEVFIDDKVWVGFNCIILKNVRIGEGAVVAAGSVVTKNVEPYTLVGGNPAKFIKNLER